MLEVGCTATRAEVFVEVAWSEKCDALAAVHYGTYNATFGERVYNASAACAALRRTPRSLAQ